jgi:putative aldouronate transport system permease protein
MANKLFWYALLNSIKRIVLGVGLNILCTILVAYPLSKDSRKFKMRNLWAWFFFIPMIFSGGIIPWFILIKELKLINSIWALVLPGAVSPFYIVVLLNFFRGIPAELEEAAIIDGCGYWRILFQIYLPLSLPAIATIAVFAILAHWNSWFDGLILMSEPKNYPLITYLQTAVININYERLTEEEIRRLALLGGSSYKAAQLFAGSLPVILSYPFLQRYFIKGLTLGSIKG